ncbi:MAG: hypothetical protein DI527_00425 [Chelatococcus sp.]|nr:MAG: hypothetical protein DI527_00425 [Chelatococcus sp.]
MTDETLKVAIAEARRFIRLATAARQRLQEDGHGNGSKESGACRRSSMDLTRALADVRRSS